MQQMPLQDVISQPDPSKTEEEKKVRPTQTQL